MRDRAFIDRLKSLIGARNVLTSERATERYRKGFRSGEGEALAVVFPQGLVDLWGVVEACVDAEKIIIMQAANTGLTEGSTPSGTYDRDVVIISTLALDKIHLLKGGEQVLALPGATLYTLERLLKPLDRAPHSEIGSSCIGASVIGGICNNSGGALVQRGPAYTELALYAQRLADGSLELVNNLGIDLGDTPEEILTRVEAGHFSDSDVHAIDKMASDHGYAERVRDVRADTPARYNADPRRLREASGCAGKLAVLAVRLDTFPEVARSEVYYIGVNDPAMLTELRHRILTEMQDLPILAEYMHREIFDIAETYGKDTFLMINWFGTDRLPLFFTLKGRADAIFKRLPLVPDHLTDWVMQIFSKCAPSHLPKRLKEYREAY
ncbi:MAG: D-lactate dehydrogenase, partial [Methyloligellaceae bacterium]